MDGWIDDSRVKEKKETSRSLEKTEPEHWHAVKPTHTESLLYADGFYTAIAGKKKIRSSVHI